MIRASELCFNSEDLFPLGQTFQSLLFIRCLLTMTNVSLPAGLCSCLKHYYLIDEPKTWHEALDYCKEKYNNLAIVNNVEDMERLIAAAGSSYEGRVWIGLYDQSEKWIWALNDWSLYGHNDWNFRNWRSGEPNDMRTHRLMCVVSRDGFWYDATCDQQFAFVCYNKTNSGE